MDEQNQALEATQAPEAATLDPQTVEACDIATGRRQADPGAPAIEITGALKDLNCKGRGPQWYRMVYRGGWRYVSNDRLPAGNFRASDRRASVTGDVWPGEIVVRHDRGGPVGNADLIVSPDDDGGIMIEIDLKRRRDGQLEFTLPDGSTVILPDPRAK